ncbi:MAG TPA: vanadium-dependent haloperoxidase [Vicinamibacterales bacterium]|jgi:hypothetical protein|nr:vanadium-dependent haloperoxidase [Vicinamibacterales bacterium]
MKNLRTAALAPLVIVVSLVTPAWADEVVDWNEMMFRAGLVGGTTPLNMSRVAAIVQSAVFDAVNGIDRRYAPVHVPASGPAGASREAAAAKAAYTALVQLYPAQKAALDARLAVSVAELGARESPGAVASGLAWGETVASAIIAWRNTDGFTPAPPPFLGGTAAGQWRPTPPGLLPGAGPQFAYMTPWVMLAPGQFQPAGPPALTSARYAADFNETKSMGNATSALRTADQTESAWFWAASTASFLWNSVARSLIVDRTQERGDGDNGRGDSDDHRSERSGRGSTLANARVLALLNLAMADAAIGCWEAKYHFVFWRPVTAIPLAATDGNAATVEDAAWTPLFATPAHPEYPSGHSCVSGAAGVVLADQFGERTRFSIDNDLMPGVVRSFRSFSSALDEVKNARINAGIHFRSATDDGQALGVNVANYVLEHALTRVGH